jgi:ribosomal 30S subunit maturation factor RimM
MVADVLTDFPERFEDLENVIAVLPNGETAELKIENFWFQKNRIILKFENFDSIEAAETLRGAKSAFPKAKRSSSKKTSFSIGNWIAAVETVEGEKIGTSKK